MKRWKWIAIAAGLLMVVPPLFIDEKVYSTVISIAGLCLLLWISEIVPPFVPTLILWTLAPMLLGPIDAKYALPNVLSWAVDPVIALFFGGFVIGVATESSGLDKTLTRFAFRSSGKSFRKFLLSVVLITAFLSMWMSNIAAAALVLACLHPILEKFDTADVARRVTLVGVALAADFGGVATPIGTGPNAIAIASISATQPVSFVSWMVFAFPLTLGMLALSYAFLLWRIRQIVVIGVDIAAPGETTNTNPVGNKTSRVAFIFILAGTVLLWLTEPVHRIPAAVVALGSAAVIFLCGILKKKDLVKIDWSTLLLIAGGITLGRLLEQSAIVKEVAANVPFSSMDPTIGLFILCLTSATLSALMSNTATAVLLIPLATALIPSPSTAILIAVSASFGVPFLISTPPNAMAFGQGGIKFGDLFWPGIVLMIFGCALVSLTGKAILHFAGVP